MTREEFYKALAANNGQSIKVKSKSGIEYWLCDGVGGLSDPHEENPYVYCVRADPVVRMAGRKRIASNQTKWMYLSGVELVK